MIFGGSGGSAAEGQGVVRKAWGGGGATLLRCRRVELEPQGRLAHAEDLVTTPVTVIPEWTAEVLSSGDELAAEPFGSLGLPVGRLFPG